MDSAVLASLLVALLTAVVGAIGYFRFRPGQKEEVELKVDKGYFEVAQGTFTLVTQEMEEQFKRMAADIASLHADVDALRGQLRGVTNERDDLARENRNLKDRVSHLEQRVEDLTNAGTGPRGAPGRTGATGREGRTGPEGREGPPGPEVE